MIIDPRSLHTAIVAAEHGSFRRAAAAIDVKQSTLSRRIRHLEQQMGVALFERSSSGVRVTVAGRKLVRTASRLLEQMDQMRSIAVSTSRGELGNIRIGVCMPLLASGLRSLLAKYLQAFQDTEIVVIEQRRRRLLAALATGEVDVAIVAGEHKSHEGASMLLWSERILVALPDSHRLSGKDVVYWTDLKGEIFLLTERDPGPDLHDILVQKLSAPGEPTRIECWNVGNESILAMLDVRRRVSIQCESWKQFNYPGVVYREIRDAIGATYFTFTACWERENSNPTLARFVELLAKHYPPTTVSNSCPSGLAT